MIKKFLNYSVGAIGSAAISFVTVPFLTRMLNPSDYGKGMLFITLITFLFYICNMGMDMGYMRYFYERKDALQQRYLFYQCFLIAFFSSVFVSFLLFFLKKYFIGFFFKENTTALYLAIILGLFFFIINRFVMLSIRMQQRAFFYSLAQILNQFVYFLGIFLLFYFFHIHNFMLIIFAQLAALFSVSLFLVFLDKDQLRFPERFDAILKKEELKELFHHSWPFLFSFMITWGMQYVDRIFLIKLSSFDQLGVYSAAFTLAAPLLMFQGVFSTMWTPIGNKILMTMPFKGRFIYQVLYKNMTIIMFFGISLIFFLKGLFVLILSQHFRGAVNIFLWLLFIPIFNLLGQLLSAGIIITKKTIWNLWGSIVGFLVNVAACWMLIPALHGLGAAISLVLGSFAFFLVRLMSNQRYYAFRINQVHFIICILLCVASFSALSFHFNRLSFLFISMLFLYQIILFFNKKNFKLFFKVFGTLK